MVAACVAFCALLIFSLRIVHEQHAQTSHLTAPVANDTRGLDGVHAAPAAAANWIAVERNIDLPTVGTLPWESPRHADAIPRGLQIGALRARSGEIHPYPHPLAVAARLARDEEQLAGWIIQWDSDFQQGIRTSPRRMTELKSLLDVSFIGCLDAFYVGRTIAYLENAPELALPWYKVAVSRAEVDLSEYRSGSVEEHHCIEALRAMSGLTWDDWSTPWPDTPRVLYRLLERYVTDPVESHKVECMYAQSLFEKGKGPLKHYNDKAAKVYGTILKSDWGSALSAVEQAEIHCMIGRSLEQAGHSAQAVPHFKIAAVFKSSAFASKAREEIIYSYAHAGNLKEANESYADWVRTWKPSDYDSQVCAGYIKVMETAPRD